MAVGSEPCIVTWNTKASWSPGEDQGEDALVSHRKKCLCKYIHLYIYRLIEQMVVVMAGEDGDEQRTERTRTLLVTPVNEYTAQD